VNLQLQQEHGYYLYISFLSAPVLSQFAAYSTDNLFDYEQRQVKAPSAAPENRAFKQQTPLMHHHDPAEKITGYRSTTQILALSCVKAVTGP
jgi:hypothetical protein